VAAQISPNMREKEGANFSELRAQFEKKKRKYPGFAPLRFFFLKKWGAQTGS
jgi:hypothetical protein